MYEKIVALSMTPELQSKIDNGEARLLGEDEYICPNCGVYDDIKKASIITKPIFLADVDGVYIGEGLSWLELHECGCGCNYIISNGA